ncbi:MAG: potassium-transporting ATPase KdpC subunit [Candidatus Hydrogenedentes bacterium]|nr:potassium-transporting ATPase KdpC subunit [Candidatus Hydrogenedentota bacterium]
MRIFARELLTSAAMTVSLAVIVCGAYPVAVFALAQGVFPGKANASIVYHKGAAAGSRLLGQQFTSPGYFHPRPSAAGHGYDTSTSGGSNLGPTSRDLIDRVRERAQKYREENNLSGHALVPADAVTASASGLDPHIGLQNAMLQAPRVAKARGMDVDAVNDQIGECTEGRTFGILGEPRVNVLELNMSLDQKYNTGK